MTKKVVNTVKEIGVDVGNDAVKIYLNKENYEGKCEFEVMNIIAPGYKRRVLGEEKGQLVNLLDVNIEKDGVPYGYGHYFVGGLAVKESRGDSIEKTKNEKKAKSLDTIVLMMTGIAYSLYDPEAPIKEENVAIGTLLPTEEFFEDELVRQFADKLKGSYKIKFNSKRFRGSEITINIVDREIQPEGVAGHLAAIYNMDGSIKEGQKVEDEIQLGIFIGSITTEVSVYDNGMFNQRAFLGLNLGTSEALDKIIDDLGLEDLSRHSVDYFIRTGKPFKVNVNGEIKDYTELLQQYAEHRYSIFVKKLVNEINRKLSTQGVKVNLITRVNLGGGGAINLLEAFREEFKIGNVGLIEDARFANAKGALFSIVSKRLESEEVAGDVFES